MEHVSRKIPAGVVSIQHPNIPMNERPMKIFYFHRNGRVIKIVEWTRPTDNGDDLIFTPNAPNKEKLVKTLKLTQLDDGR